MSSDDMTEGVSSFDRRGFLKKVAIATAVIAPIVTTFSMDGVNTVFAAGDGNVHRDGSAYNSCNPNEYRSGSELNNCDRQHRRYREN
jgi:hypothetical protein